MAKKREVQYWDACVFVAWLNAEDQIHGAAVMDGIREMVDDVDGGRIVMITSVMTKTEVIHRLRTQWAKDEFTKFFQRPNVSIVAQDERISDKSSEIREFYARKGVTLDAGDCVHLATAILYRANDFYTLDGNAEKPKPNALLPLDGDVAGHYLSIRRPHSKQGSLFTGVPKVAVSSAIKNQTSKRALRVVASNPDKPAGKR